MPLKKYDNPYVTCLRMDKDLIILSRKIGVEIGEMFILGLLTHVNKQVKSGSLPSECLDELNSLISSIAANENKSAKFNGIRRTPEIRAWAGAVKHRDDMKCRCCGSLKRVEAHHIISVQERPDLKLDLDNGISLCKKCHKMVHTHIIDLSAFVESVSAGE